MHRSRCHTSAAALALLGAWVLGSHAAAAGMLVRGRVFLDANENGRFDPGERGLPRVFVTDGLRFVRTAPDGTYELEARLDPLLHSNEKPIISVSFPSGYWPVGGLNAHFRRVGDVAHLASVDFPLREEDQTLPFLFVHATDPHVPHGGREVFAHFVSELADFKGRAPFCVLTGDFVALADWWPPERARAEYAVVAAALGRSPLPYFGLPGNHDPAGIHQDNGWDEHRELFGYGLYWRTVGPLRWSFDYAGVHFVGVDFNHVADGTWAWGTPETGVKWLLEDLGHVRPGTRVFLFCHYPTTSLEPVLATDRITQIFAGHLHVDRALRFHGVPVVLSGSIAYIAAQRDRQPGYRIVRVTRDGFGSFYKALGDDHAITVDAPRSGKTVMPGDTIRGGFWDPHGRIKALTIKLGSAGGPCPFTRTPLACRFTYKPDLAAVPPGLQTLDITVSGPSGKSTYTRRHLCHGISASAPAPNTGTRPGSSRGPLGDAPQQDE